LRFSVGIFDSGCAGRDSSTVLSSAGADDNFAQNDRLHSSFFFSR
jgi:hypothetical protein